MQLKRSAIVQATPPRSPSPEMEVEYAPLQPPPVPPPPPQPIIVRQQPKIEERAFKQTTTKRQIEHDHNEEG